MNYLLCRNGHYYADNLPECPYCPKEKGETVNTPEKTKVLSNTAGTLERTKVQEEFVNLSKTLTPNTENKSNSPEQKGKLSAWLVSFTHNSLGDDYKLYEGQNLVGSSIDCDITVIGDKLISAKHLTISCQNGEFLFKEEASANEILHNEEIKKEGILKDGDQIKIGNTLFLFKGI